MAFIDVKLIEGDTITINTGYIFKVMRGTSKLGTSLIVYDYAQEVFDEIAEPYALLVKRIIEAEEGDPEEEN